VTGFFGPGLAGTVATWAAALTTIVVWSYLLGERRLFRLAQRLLAGLATGYLVLLALREVLVPRLLEPLAAAPVANVLLWPALVLVAALAGARWLPRPIVAVPVAVLVAGTAAFALGGAVAGTVLPQLGASLVQPASASGVVDGVIGLGITVAVLLAFLHGVPRGRIVGGVASIGRWMLIGGVGGWLGFLLVSRLAVLVDRVGFLLGDWLGVVAR
jgi:hypothetical protein